MDIDVSKTKTYYDSITEESLCDCAYCRSYRTQIKSAYPQVAVWLESMGADIEKTFETSPLEPDEKGMLDYCACQYIMLGCCEPEYIHKIGDVEIRVATSYPHTGIEDAHFVLEMFPIRLRFIP